MLHVRFKASRSRRSRAAKAWTLALVSGAMMLQGCASNQKTHAGCGPEERANCICSKPGVVSFAVEGLSCPNCAKELAEVLRGVPGVTDAKVCFEEKRAFVTLDKTHPATMDAIMAAVKQRDEEHLKLESDPSCLNPKS